MKIYTTLILLLLLIFSSCSVQQEITLNSEGGGTCRGDVHVSEVFADYLAELASLSMEESEDFVLFETEKIKNDIEKEQSGVSVRKIQPKDKNTLHLELTFSSIEKLVRSEEARSAEIIRLEESANGQKTVHIHLDRYNYKHLNTLFSEEQSLVMDTFGPEENEGLTEEEYLDMMSFALGEEGPELILSSTIETRITVEGTIIEQKGGVRKDNTVIFRIPLIRILLLDQPLDYSLTFR